MLGEVIGLGLAWLHGPGYGSIFTFSLVTDRAVKPSVSVYYHSRPSFLMIRFNCDVLSFENYVIFHPWSCNPLFQITFVDFAVLFDILWSLKGYFAFFFMLYKKII